MRDGSDVRLQMFCIYFVADGGDLLGVSSHRQDCLEQSILSCDFEALHSTKLLQSNCQVLSDAYTFFYHCILQAPG
jgi:hypothetical protein